MSELRESVGTTAMVLGYLVLAVLVVLVVWAMARISLEVERVIRKIRYERRMRLIAESEWDHIRDSWLVKDRLDDERNTHDRDDRHDTDIIPVTLEQLFNFQEDQRHDRS